MTCPPLFSDWKSVRGLRVFIAVLYETRWRGLLRPSWGRDMDLQHLRQHTHRYWTGTLNQHRQTNGLYLRMRVRATPRELARASGECSASPVFVGVLRNVWATLPALGASCWGPTLVQDPGCLVVARQEISRLTTTADLHRAHPRRPSTGQHRPHASSLHHCSSGGSTIVMISSAS